MKQALKGHLHIKSNTYIKVNAQGFAGFYKL